MVQLQDFNSQIQIDSLKRNQVPVFAHPKLMHQIRVRVRNKTRKRTLAKNRTRNKIEDIQSCLQIKRKMTIGFKPSQFQQGLQRKVTFIHGNKIQGTWKNGNLHGFVIIQYQTGQYFQGKYLHGIRVEGKVKFKDGTEYCGNFLNDLFHGKGNLKDPSGRIITCEWEQGQPTQKAKIQYPSGDTYFGEIKNLKKHGTGHLFFKNGSKYVGNFINGAITGYGCFYENNQKIAEGIWQNGVLQVQENIKQILLQTLKIQKQISIESEIDTYFPSKRKLKD